MRRFVYIVLCLTALTTLVGCGVSYDHVYHSESLYYR
jgi:hypothetical protein